MAGQRRSSAQRRCRATSRKDSNKLRYHHYDDNRLKPMQQHMRTMIARIVLVVIILLLCFLMHPPRIWNSRAVADNTICNVADSSSDESCVISNDDAATDKGNNRVPQECTLVMAPSGIKNSGWGVFTLTPRKRGEMVTDPGVFCLVSLRICVNALHVKMLTNAYVLHRRYHYTHSRSQPASRPQNEASNLGLPLGGTRGWWSL